MTVQALITEAEAAAMIGLSPRTLRALRSAGKIRYVRPSPRKVLYKPEDVAEYIERVTCQDEPACPSCVPAPTDTRQAYLAEVRSQITKGDRECVAAAPTEASALADEPVAWMYEHPSDGKYASPVKRFLHPGWTETPLYAAPPASVDRNAVLEEAAKEAERIAIREDDSGEHLRGAGAYVAALAIRALRTEAPAQVDGGE